MLEKDTKKAIHKSHKHHAHKSSKKKFKPNVGYAVLGAAALIIIVVLIINFNPGNTEPPNPTEIPEVAAIVNGEEISVSEIEEQWDILPDEYKAQVSKGIILTQTIEKVLLLQDAEEKGIEVTTERAQEFVDELLEESGFSEEYLENQLSTRGITMDEIIEMYREQLIVVELVNATIFPLIEISEEEITAFYEANQENLESLEESREEIVMLLKMGKQTGAIQAYVDGLEEDADIEIIHSFENTGNVIVGNVIGDDGFVPASSITTFSETGDDLCTEGGKPAVYLFSTTWCGHCNWVGDTFDKIVLEYAEKGIISTYHWEIDTGDDTLTTEVETEVPVDHMAVYKKYNPRGSIPTFVFGCEYSRVGNGHELSGDVSSEEAEFRAVIDAIVG